MLTNKGTDLRLGPQFARGMKRTIKTAAIPRYSMETTTRPCPSCEQSSTAPSTCDQCIDSGRSESEARSSPVDDLAGATRQDAEDTSS